MLSHWPLRSCAAYPAMAACIAHALLMAPAAGAAEDPPKGLYQTLSDGTLSEDLGIDEFGIDAGGWLTVGINHNFAEPEDRLNSPVSFNDRTDELHLHQLNLFFERSVDLKSGRFDWGGRFDAMFGTDTPYTQATGHWDDNLIDQKDLRFYDVALPQAYLEVGLPWGNGLSAKIGHFYSIIGYESVPSPPNFFYSHSYSMKSSPFTHTGALLSYALRDDLTLYSGAVTGADNFDRHFGAWSFLGGFNWTADDGESGLSFSVLNGDASDTFEDNRTYFTAIWRQLIGQKWHYVLQHDRGWQDQAFGPGSASADWYSLVQYLSYDVADSLGAGIRAEWFRDQNGSRYNAGEAGYYAVTLGLNWKPLSFLTLRPELRYDWADSATPAYARGSRDNQLLIGADAVVEF
ncbi:porin [Methylomicrobium lacus]|uniref:porin n=1 Tax=Methylomicrobium lacus TaxID=136992 RepID=UPI0035A867E4